MRHLNALRRVLPRFSVLGTVFLLAACGSGSSSGSSDSGASGGSNSQGQTPAAAPELSSLAPTSFAATALDGAATSFTLSFANTGDAALTYELSSTASWITFVDAATGSVASGANVSVELSAICGETDLSGSVLLSTNDADEASQSLPVNLTCQTPSSYEIARVAVNQGARAFDSDVAATPNIDMIAGRDTLVRAFVTGDGPVPPAQVVISRPGLSDVVVQMTEPASVDDTPADESLLVASHHARVAGTHLREDSTLSIVVNPGSATSVTYPQGAPLDLRMRDPGSLDITFVPVTYQGQTPTINVDAYMADLRKVLPVGEFTVEVRTPYVFTGAYELDQLLTDMADLRDADGSQRLYHGVIIPPSGSTSNTAGIGYVGYPASVSIDLGGSQFVVAHEVGHNLGLGHAPGCGAPNADSDYPHDDARIGVWGWDLDTSSLISPNGAARDFMSYCNSNWVSDYHFDAALDHRTQSSIGFRQLGQRGLAISGSMRPGGAVDVRMLATDSLRSMADGEETTHTFVAWDENGTEVARHGFALHQIMDGQGAQNGFSFMIEAPQTPIYSYQIEFNGAVVHSARAGAVDPSTVTRVGHELVWQPVHGASLVVRNAQGTVIAIDRSGRVPVDATIEHQVSLQQVGLPLQIAF